MELKLEMLLANLVFDLHKLGDEMNEIESEWDGDEEGELEDRANIAKEVKEKAIELESLMSELEECF